MPFVVRLEDDQGNVLESLPDPRGHITLALVAARQLGVLRLAELEPYWDYTFVGRSASKLVGDLEALRSSFSQQVLEEAKRELWEWWAHFGLSNDQEAGYRNYLEMADLKYMLELLERLAVLAQRSLNEEGPRLVFYGD
jgi:hypothetical protein